MQIFAYISHNNGKAEDSAFEIATAAKKIDASASVTALVIGENIDALCDEMAGVYSELWKIKSAGLAHPDGALLQLLLAKILPKGCVFLMSHDYLALDMAPGLAVRMNAAYLPDALDIEGLDGNLLKATRQEYGGMVSAHNSCDISSGAVITLRGGAFASEEKAAIKGSIVDKSGEANDLPKTGRRFLEVLEAEAGDVDISSSEVLVSVGRGIEDQDNIEIIKELAKAMGADYSCSRPIVDAKWMEKSRQVGTSGKSVKPKIYMALGISGAFQHLGGIKGSPFIIAINKNPKAPIFQIADIGIVGDILEIVPQLTEKIQEMKG